MYVKYCKDLLDSDNILTFLGLDTGTLCKLYHRYNKYDKAITDFKQFDNLKSYK